MGDVDSSSGLGTPLTRRSRVRHHLSFPSFPSYFFFFKALFSNMTVFQKGAFKAEILLRLHIKKASKTYFLYLIGVLKTLLLLMSNFAVPSL